MNPYRSFVADIARLVAEAKALPLGDMPPACHPTLLAELPSVLLFSPHPDDECIGTLPDCALKCRAQSLRLSHVEKLRLEAEGSRCRLDLFPRRGKRGTTHVEEDSDSGGSRKQFPEKLDPFCVELRDNGADPGDISTRVGEARDDSVPDGIGKPRNDDRNRRRRILGGQGRWRSPGQDQVHVQPNQFSRQSRVSFVSAVGRSVLDDEILPLDVSELPKTPPEGLEIGRIRRTLLLPH